MTDTAAVFNILWPYVVTYIAGHGGSILLQKIQSKLHGFRELVDIMDNAMTNNSVSEADAQATWKLVKAKLST